jgi:hypothetical protein
MGVMFEFMSWLWSVAGALIDLLLETRVPPTAL